MWKAKAFALLKILLTSLLIFLFVYGALSFQFPKNAGSALWAVVMVIGLRKRGKQWINVLSGENVMDRGN